MRSGRAFVRRAGKWVGAIPLKIFTTGRQREFPEPADMSAGEFSRFDGTVIRGSPPVQSVGYCCRGGSFEYSSPAKRPKHLRDGRLNERPGDSERQRYFTSLQ